MTIQRLFDWTYKHTENKRAHAHRCRCCWQILKPGESVLALRLSKRTWMLHQDCAETPHGEKTTWRDAFKMWAAE